MTDDDTRRALRALGDTINQATRAIRALKRGDGQWDAKERADLIAMWEGIRAHTEREERALLAEAARHA